MYKNTALAQTITTFDERMYTMYPNENHSQKNAKHENVLPEGQPVAGKNKTKPGAAIPPEKEMSPPQLG